MMKLSFVSIALILFVLSCSKEDSLKSDSFVVENADGSMVADGKLIDNWTRTIVQKKFGNLDFIVTKVQVSHIKDSYSALIEYKITGGQKSNFIVTNNREDIPVGRFADPCKTWSIACNGSCCDIVTGPNTTEYQCSCNRTPSGTTCSMTVACLDNTN
jgi:hypothetical protein